MNKNTKGGSHAASLRWLANQFPRIEEPKDDADRLCNCIHLYCSTAADRIDILENAKREIFEEIEKSAKTVAYPETLVNGIIVSHTLDGLYLGREDFEELKKKFMKGEW